MPRTGATAEPGTRPDTHPPFRPGDAACRAFADRGRRHAGDDPWQRTGPTPTRVAAPSDVLVRALPAAHRRRGRSPSVARSTGSPRPVPSSSRSPTARAGPRAAARSTCCATSSRTPTSSRWRTSPASARRTPRRTASSASSSTRASRASSRCAATRPTGADRGRRCLGDLGSAGRTRAAHPPGAGGARAVRPGGRSRASRAHAHRRAASASTIAVAAFPNGHPRSRSRAQDVDTLLAKEAAGANLAITQLFFARRRLPRLRRARPRGRRDDAASCPASCR